MDEYRKKFDDPDVCPECGEQLEFPSGEFDDGYYVYEVMCPKCEWEGLVYYTLEYCETVWTE